MGICFSPSAFTPCFVVCDTWPGWLAILPSFGFQCLHLVCSSPSAPWLPRVLLKHPGCTTTLLEYEGLPPALLGYRFGFMQGSSHLATFCAQYSFPQLVCSLNLDTRCPTPSSLQSFTLSHETFGGVMRGQWEFWCSRTVKQPSPPSVQERTLYHIIDSARRAPDFQVTSAVDKYVPRTQVCWADTAETIVDSCGLLPAQAVRGLVRCPLIYSPTKWAIRTLTIKELLGVFDFSESLLSVLEDDDQMPFVQSTPGRLLSAVISSLEHDNCPRFSTINRGRHRVGAQAEPSVPMDLPHWPTMPGTEWHGTSESTTTADETQAHTLLWDRRVLQHFPQSSAKVARFVGSHGGQHPLDVIRHFLLRLWRKRICRSLLKFLRTPEGKLSYGRNVAVGRDCLVKATGASWWEWLMGSTTFFWRWPQHSRILVRDGHPPAFVSEPPRWIRPQRMDPDSNIREMVKAKMLGVIQKGYIAEGKVKSLTSYFSVPKGADDIWMVYDATASGLNECL